MEYNIEKLDKEVGRILEEFKVKNNSLPLKHRIYVTFPKKGEDEFTLISLIVRVTDREGFNHTFFKADHATLSINYSSSRFEEVSNSLIKQLTTLLEKGIFDRSLETFKGWEL
uniref:Uncharacterized protein n=1 Tax=Podoviridae sp. ctwFJ1 TaxID=2826586 RepID=A0A8S5NNN1_9CAUD|nr:MAG TPA: hypothetical protein [Podoviridae sp. ctwFJ1]